MESVVFRKYKTGGVVALFPYEILNTNGNCLAWSESYNGFQSVDYKTIFQVTKPAVTTKEKDNVLNRLKELGFKGLKILTRPAQNKVLKARLKFLDRQLKG